MEGLIAIAILVVILGAGAPVALNFYLDYQFDAEYELMFSLLQQSANLSLTNYHEASHGLYWNNQKFIVFEGNSFAVRTVAEDRIYPRSDSITITGAGELVFAALDGSAASTTYSLSDGRKTRYIYVNPEGLTYTDL